MMKRAYAVLEIKAVDGEKRTFSGIATTPSTDRMGDVVEPDGATFKLPIPLLWQHDSSDPIGWVRTARVTGKGIEVDGEIASIPEDGPLKQRLDTAWQMLKAKLVRGLSIGFNSIESARIDGTYGIRFLKWEWLELSAVTIPANQDATITAIKSIDQQLLAASGRGQVQRSAGLSTPGASGINLPKGKAMNIKELREARDQKKARMGELIELKKAEQRSFTDEEAGEFDVLAADVQKLDDDIRVAQFDALNAATAAPVTARGMDEGTRSRVPGGMVFSRNADPDDKFAGQSYIRGVIARAAAFMEMKNGNIVSPADIAAARWGKSHPNLVRYIRSAVAGGGTGSGEWGAELAASDARYTGDFITYLYSLTVYDRLPLREVPPRVHIKGQDGAATGYWVGESKAIPVSTADFSDVELTPLKVGALAVCSKELIRDSSPSAEMWIRDVIANASGQRVDQTFLSATAASSGVSPAGLLNGLTPVNASGTDAAAVRADLMSLYTGFLTAKNASGLYQVMTPSMAKALSLLVNALGQTEFPGLNANGGTLLGDPVVTGDNVTAGHWILLKPSDIWKIGDTGLDISMSDQATIEMNDAPAGASDTPTAMASHTVSMYQTESVAFKVVRSINFQKRRSSAVAYVQDCEYGGVVS